MDSKTTEFTEFEQWENNYEFYLVDRDGRIGVFSHGGFRMLPPAIASDRHRFEKLVLYFEEIPDIPGGNAAVCPDLLRNIQRSELIDFERYVDFYSHFSRKGLYSFDSYNPGEVGDRAYFRVSCPGIGLCFEELPQEMRNLLLPMRVDGYSFENNSVIPASAINAI